MNTALVFLFVLAAPAALMLGLRAFQRRGKLHPELARKLFHIGGGLVALALPWLTLEPAAVIALTAVSLAGLLAIEHNRTLDEKAGRVLSAVERDSWGQIAFPLSVCIVFLVARHDLVLYSVPILILAFGDAAAALIGVRYGLSRFSSTDGLKSLEGSMAFFLTAFFSVHVPLLLGTDTDRVASLLIALILALLVMMVEAVAWKGLDNFFVPLASLVLLRAFLRLTVPELFARLVLTALLAAAVLIGGRSTTLNTSGRVGAVFVGYVLWMGGGWQWFLMPFLLLVTYRFLAPSGTMKEERVHDIRVVLNVCAAGLLWLFFAETLDWPDLYLPFTISFAAHLALVALVRRELAAGTAPSLGAAAGYAIAAWAVLFLPYALIESGVAWTAETGWEILSGLAGVAVAVVVYRLISPPPSPSEVNLVRWRWQAAAAGLGSLAGLWPAAGTVEWMAR